MNDLSSRSRALIRVGGKPLSPAFWFTACIALGSGLLIATLGLDRPYDAIPDQDLLWLREALLMHHESFTEPQKILIWDGVVGPVQSEGRDQ